MKVRKRESEKVSPTLHSLGDGGQLDPSDQSDQSEAIPITFILTPEPGQVVTLPRPEYYWRPGEALDASPFWTHDEEPAPKAEAARWLAVGFPRRQQCSTFESHQLLGIFGAN